MKFQRGDKYLGGSANVTEKFSAFLEDKERQYLQRVCVVNRGNRGFRRKSRSRSGNPAELSNGPRKHT